MAPININFLICLYMNFIIFTSLQMYLHSLKNKKGSNSIQYILHKKFKTFRMVEFIDLFK